MAEQYRYHFENNLKEKDFTEELELDVGSWWQYKDLQQLIIYDESEKEARRQFKELFNKEAGKLLRREPW